MNEQTARAVINVFEERTGMRVDVMLHAGQRSLMNQLYANVIFSRPDEVAAITLLLIGGPLLLHRGFARRIQVNG